MLKLAKRGWVLLIASTTLLVASTTINQGWNLKGAINGVNPADISCAKYIWGWQNGSWKLYVKNNTSNNNYGYNTLNNIEQGDGFWVYSDNGGCSVPYQGGSSNGVNNDIPYYAYGLKLYDRRTGDKYTVEGNSVVFDGNSTFIITANKLQNKDSRRELYLHESNIVASEATFRFDINGSTGSTNANENLARLIMCGFEVNSTDANDNACFSTNIKKNKVDFWYEVYNSGQAVDISSYDHNISFNNYVGQNIKLQEEINGTQIIVNIYNDNGTRVEHFIYDTKNNSLPLKNNTKGKLVAVTAKVLDNKDPNSPAAQTSVVTLKDFKVIRDKHISGTLVDTISFPAPGHYIVLNTDEGDKPGFDEVNITETNGNYQITDVSYQYDGTTWHQTTESNVSIDSTGNIVTPNGTISIKPIETRKVVSVDGQSFDGEAYVTYAIDTTIAQSSNWESSFWSWINPSYYDANSSQQISITSISDLITGFTTSNMWKHLNHLTIYLNPNGDIVLGRFDGYKQNCSGEHCKKFVRTDIKVGTWSSDENYIYLNAFKKEVRLSVVQENGNYLIKEERRDEIGARDYDTILTGPSATVDTIKQLIESGDNNQTGGN